jgi:hypothetical protein
MHPSIEKLKHRERESSELFQIFPFIHYRELFEKNATTGKISGMVWLYFSLSGSGLLRHLLVFESGYYLPSSLLVQGDRGDIFAFILKSAVLSVGLL